MSDNRNRRGRRRFPKERERPQEPKPEIVYPDCCMCGKSIRDIYSSILHKDSGLPAHFDCIMKELSTQEEIGEGERLSYLGSGIFGIIRQSPQGQPQSLTIRKKILYEDKEKAAVWRRTLNITAG